jgi:acyl-CoA thioesterase YciA
MTPATMEPTIKVIAMPADTNPDGDVFGGWLMSMLDLAGAILARRRAGCRIVTVAAEHIVFVNPVFVGDLVECFARIVKVGRSSIAVEVEARVERRFSGETLQATTGSFVYVAVDENRRPVPVSGTETS